MIAINRSITKNYSSNKKTVWAFYDLEVSPATYDFVNFIALAKGFCIEEKATNLHIVIVFSNSQGFRKNELHNPAELFWRFNQIILNSALSFASHADLHICKTREEAQSLFNEADYVYPKDYSIENPKSGYNNEIFHQRFKQKKPLGKICSSRVAQKYIQEWIKSNAKGRKVISITLRECNYAPERNNNIPEWTVFIKNLNPDVFYSVIIRDTENALDKSLSIGSAHIFEVPAYNIDLRAALYEKSFINLMVSGGPSALLFNNSLTNFIYLKIANPPQTASASLDYLIKTGITPGIHFPGCTNSQLCLWEDDRASVIELAFAEMVKQLDGQPITPMETMLNNARQSLAVENKESAWDWSAVAVAFYNDEVDAWKERIRILSLTERKQEAIAMEKHVGQNWGAFEMLCIKLEKLIDLGDIYALLSSTIKCIEQFPDKQFIIASLFNRRFESKWPKFLPEAFAFHCSTKENKKPCEIIIFGASLGGSHYKQILNNEFEVIGFSDNDTSKQNHSYSGLPVYPPEQLPKTHWQQIHIASAYWPDIYRQLACMGFPLSLIKIVDPKSLIS